MKKYLDSLTAFLLSYVIVFFQLYSLFYLWYDTVSVIFFLLGDILLLNALENSNVMKKKLLFVGAGIAHCYMAFSYPSFILVAVSLGIILFIVSVRVYKVSIKESFLSVFWYGLGACAVILSLVIYFQSHVGLKTVFETFRTITSSRGANSLSFLDMVRDIIIAYLKVNKFLIPVTICLIILFLKSLKNKKFVQYFLVGVVVLPIFNQFFIGKNSLMGLANYLSYISLWCPFIYYLMKDKTRLDKTLLLIFYLPTLVSMIAITMTSLYAAEGPVKCWQACLPSSIATLYYLIIVWKQNSEKTKKGYIYLLGIVILTLLFNSYSYIYLNQPYISFSDTRMKHGLFAGIKVNEKMKKQLELQNYVNAHITNCDTILAGSSLRTIYLMTDLKPFVWGVQSPAYYIDNVLSWDRCIMYFEYFNEYPDIMFLEKHELDNEKIQQIIKERYRLCSKKTIASKKVYVYKKSEL